MDFTENLDHKLDFLRCAVRLHCPNPMANTRKSSLPLLEDLAEGVTV